MIWFAEPQSHRSAASCVVNPRWPRDATLPCWQRRSIFCCCCRCCCCCCCCLFLWGLLEILEDSWKFFEELLRLIHNDIMQLKMRDSWTNSFEGRRRDALKLFAISLSLSCRFSLKCDWIIRKGWWGDSRRDSFKDSSRDSTNRCWVMAQSRPWLLTYDPGRFCHSPINIHPISHS